MAHTTIGRGTQTRTLHAGGLEALLILLRADEAVTPPASAVIKQWLGVIDADLGFLPLPEDELDAPGARRGLREAVERAIAALSDPAAELPRDLRETVSNQARLRALMLDAARQLQDFLRATAASEAPAA